MNAAVLETWLTLPPRDHRVSDDSGAYPRTRRHTQDALAGNPLATIDDPIVERIRNGDEQAFATLVECHGERLFRFAYRELKSKTLAEDVVQDVFANVWARRAVWLVRDSVVTYLFQSVRHGIQNVRRSQRTADRFEASLLPMSPIVHRAPTADMALAESDLLAALERAMARLPERPRQVFHLHREQRLSFREIALVLDISVRTVEHHMARAIGQLRIELAEWLS